MELNLQWLTETMMGEFTLTMLVSMLPVVELRGGIPFGVAAGLPVWAAFLASTIGNLIPVPFIIVYIRRVFQWTREKLPKLNRLVDALERKAHLKGRRVNKYKYLGLAIFVAIPLPGTGAWTGSMAAAFLDMPLRRALPSMIAGVVTAGLAISILTYGVASLF
ncbi:MAG: small multi-drug export protein [Oscillospiraceae bacterium]|nr:small multi-drug export protein [Oscillospiraceae bacterium]MDE7171983.1 small multi-drug export protein [Oscillospiraceae bacterium]